MRRYNTKTDYWIVRASAVAAGGMQLRRIVDTLTREGIEVPFTIEEPDDGQRQDMSAILDDAQRAWRELGYLKVAASEATGT